MRARVLGDGPAVVANRTRGCQGAEEKETLKQYATKLGPEDVPADPDDVAAWNILYFEALQVPTTTSRWCGVLYHGGPRPQAPLSLFTPAEEGGL